MKKANTPDYEYRLRKWTSDEKLEVVKLRENSGLGAKGIADKTGIPIDQVRFWIYGSRSTKKKTKRPDAQKHRDNNLRMYYRMKYNDWQSWKAQTICSSLRVKSKKHGQPFISIGDVRGWLDNCKMVCTYCNCLLDSENFGVDHAQPLSRGGDNNISNLVACCKDCNSSKGSLSENEYRQLITLVSGWGDGGASLLARLRYSGLRFNRR